jgi:TetR/AcrR family transcriptional regulator, transcriptional repressor for nem operon
MRVSREQAAENRKRIVETASRMFREKGFDGVGVDAIMKGAGLTHGGFYGHFRSKDDLAAESVTRALERGSERQSRFTDLNDLVSDYLSDRHRTDRADGCAIAALGAEIARQGEDMRRGVAAHVRAQLDRFSHLLKGGTAASRRKRAIATLAGIIGALMLARAVEDPALSDEILTAARDAFGDGAAVKPER